MSRWHPGAEPIGVLPRSALVGRDSDAEALEAACGRSRIVTLLGAGGAGKTALAAAVAPAVAESLGVECWWVDLQPVEDSAGVAPALAAALDVPVAGDGPAAAAELARTLGDRALLVVLDNCEQVIDGVAEALEVVTSICSEVRVLSTSREVVGIAGEEVRRLRPLSAPDSSATPDVEALRVHAATALFLDRAGVDPVGLDGADRVAVAAICRAVDGLPLAIELAAARSPALTPVQIEEALTDRFRLLSTRRRTVADRQQTLEASIGWSYELLADDEQLLLRSVAVFPAAFDLAGAAAVGADGNQALALDVLAGLIDKSLVAVQERPSGRRYRLYESVRAFGERELARHEETDAVRDRHLTATLSRLEALRVSDNHEGLILRTERWLTDEMDDIRAASQRALTTGRPELAVDLWWAVHLWGHALDVVTQAPEALGPVEPDALDRTRSVRREVLLLRGTPGSFVAGRVRDIDADSELPLTRVLATTWDVYWRPFRLEEGGSTLARQARELLDQLEPSQPDLVRAIALVVAAQALDFAGDPDGVDVARRAATIADRVGADPLRAACYQRLASVTMTRLLPETADHIATLVDLLPRVPPVRQVLAVQAVVFAAFTSGDLSRATAAFERYGRATGAVGSTLWIIGQTLDAHLALWSGRFDDAVAAADAAVTGDDLQDFDLFWLQSVRASALAWSGDWAAAADAAAAAEQTLGDGSFGASLHGVVALSRIQLALADDRADDALDLALRVCADVTTRDDRNLSLLPTLVLAGSQALAALDRPKDAARSIGVLTHHLAAPGLGLVPVLQADLDQLQAEMRSTLGDDEFEDAASTGHDLSWTDWIDWLQRGRGPRETQRPAAGWASLTDTEAEVATLAAQGLSNAELADALFVSINTVKTHIRNVYVKLDIHSRAELANLVADLD